MCILFIHTNPAPQSGQYRLIIASNRDEYYHRPAEAAALCSKLNVIGGRDMEEGREGGMWLGVSLSKGNGYNFRFGALLNLTGEERKQGVEGRGPLVARYLENEIAAKDYVENLKKVAETHNAFNFVAVELGDANSTVFHQSNIPNRCVVFNGEQTVGFGNSTVDVPLLKVTVGRDRFASIISSLDKVEDKTELISELVKLLKWDQKHLPDPELQRRAPTTFQFLSSIYVKTEPAVYGSRAHSIILVDYDWNVDFTEISMEQPINFENPTWETKTFKARL